MQDMMDPRKAFAKEVIGLARENNNILAVSADSAGSAHLEEFRELFPERYFEFGLMEPSIIGFCAGLALSGKIPFFCAITPFITMRAFEQVRNDLVYTFANAKIVGRNSGLTNDRFGPTHHSLEDVALMRTLPGMVVIVPSDPYQVRGYVREAAGHKGPCYIRLGSVKTPFLYSLSEEFKIGEGKLWREGKDVTVVTSGITLWYTLEALKMIEKESSLEVGIIDMPCVKPLDEKLLLETSKHTAGMLVIEEHSSVGGLGGAVSEFLSQVNPIPLKILGVPDVFALSGPYDELMDKYNLSPRGICSTLRSFVKELKEKF
ncbi:transketolase [Candidatus Aerophobetes bacterium]|nr:transketolase [Candidatus Aerophobetes bacterium]